MSKFQYLGGIIPFTFVIVLFVTVLIWCLFLRPTCCGQKRKLPIGDNPEFTNFQRYVYGYPFEFVYKSGLRHILGNTLGMYLLLLWRIAAFCYFFGIVFLWNYIRNTGDNAHYFTLWNIDLISAFYFLAIIASIIGIANDANFEKQKGTLLPTVSDPLVSTSFWSPSLTQFGYALQILYEITGSTAFFVTVVAFGTLDPHFVFWNVNDHFMTTMSILVELSLNNLIVRWEHVLFTIYWALLYLIFIWPMVAMGVLGDWPYFFLATDTTAVFPWYIGLFIGLILFYYLFWAVSWLKYYGIEKAGGGNVEQDGRLSSSSSPPPPPVAAGPPRESAAGPVVFSLESQSHGGNYHYIGTSH